MVQMVERAVFSIPELAQYLGLKPITVEKHARGGRIPGFKAGGQWRFKKATIEIWIKNQEQKHSKSKVRSFVGMNQTERFHGSGAS